MSVRSSRLAVLLATGLVAAPLAGQGTAARCGPAGIALFNSVTLLDSMPGRATAEREYQQRLASARRQLAAAADSLKFFVDQFARGEPQFTAVQREVALHLIRARELQFEDFAQQVQVTDDEWRQELRTPLLARVTAAAEVVRAQRNCTLLLDRSVLGPAVVAGPTSLDLTPAILAELRRRPEAP